MHNIKTTLGYHVPGDDDRASGTYVYVCEAEGPRSAFAKAVRELKLDLIGAATSRDEVGEILDLKPWAISYDRNVEAAS